MNNAKKTVRALACAGVGYSLGEINSAYLMGLRKGYDIRNKGTGNPGATNTMLLEGTLAGALVTLFDIGKAAASVSLCRRLFPNYKCAGETAGTAAILGHMFPAKLDFRGGKHMVEVAVGQPDGFDLHPFFAGDIQKTVGVVAGVDEHAAAVIVRKQVAVGQQFADRQFF